MWNSEIVFHVCRRAQPLPPTSRFLFCESFRLWFHRYWMTLDTVAKAFFTKVDGNWYQTLQSWCREYRLSWMDIGDFLIQVLKTRFGKRFLMDMLFERRRKWKKKGLKINKSAKISTESRPWGSLALIMVMLWKWDIFNVVNRRISK
jgi:hypothetical protein